MFDVAAEMIRPEEGKKKKETKRKNRKGVNEVIRYNGQIYYSKCLVKS